MPFFSVIIPTYNRSSSVKAAIDSVLGQTFRDFEPIVVDDGSTDGTPGIVAEYGDRLHYIVQPNAGVSAARNAGIKASSGGHLAFLDSDDLWLPGKLQAHYEYITSNPRMRIHQTEELWIRNGRRVNPMNKHRKEAGNIFIPSLRLCLVSPSAVVIRRDLLDEAGLFDERLPACEDYDLWLRISMKKKIGLIPEAFVIKHGGHEDQLSRAFWGMDRFRIYSILKLLREHGPDLRAEYRESAIAVAREKSLVLYKGAVKRGKDRFAERLQPVIEALDAKNYSSTDPGILLEE